MYSAPLSVRKVQCIIPIKFQQYIPKYSENVLRTFLFNFIGTVAYDEKKLFIHYGIIIMIIMRKLPGDICRGDTAETEVM